MKMRNLRALLLLIVVSFACQARAGLADIRLRNYLNTVMRP